MTTLTTAQIVSIQEAVKDSILASIADEVTTAMNDEGVEGFAPEELIDMVSDNIFN